MLKYLDTRGVRRPASEAFAISNSVFEKVMRKQGLVFKAEKNRRGSYSVRVS